MSLLAGEGRATGEELRSAKPGMMQAWMVFPLREPRREFG
jgi:hypothetical protein